MAGKKMAAGKAVKSPAAAAARPVDDPVDDSLENPSALFDDAEDAEKLPAHVRRLFEFNDFIANREIAYIKQYVYRFDGATGSTPKSIVGCVKDLKEILTPHDVGERFRRAGLYEILVEIGWFEGGELMRKTRNVPYFRVGEEYERGPAGESAAPAAVSTSSPLTDFLRLQEGFTQMAVSILGKQPPASPVDVSGIEARYRAMVEEADARNKQVSRQLDTALAELRELRGAAAPAAPVEKKDAFTPETLEKWAGSAGTVVRAAKDVLGALTPTPPAADAAAGAV